MSLLLLQRDAGSGDKVMRMAELSAAEAANWNNTVTPSTLVKLLVIFECRVEAQQLWLGTGQWDKSRFSASILRWLRCLLACPKQLCAA